MIFRIDSHQRFTPEHPAEHFGPILARNRFAGSVCVVDADQPLSIGDFDFVLAIVVAGRPGPWRAHPKFRGVLLREMEAIDWLGGNDTLDLLVRPADLPAVARLAQHAPERRIVIDHLGCPDVAGGDFAEWSAAIEGVARFPQVCCKLSGLVRLAAGPWKAADLRPYVHRALRCFGPDRLMFGSGWPDCLPEYAWKETLAAFTQALGAAPIPMREQLLGGTAARFYGIDSAPDEGAI
ncbi:MAG TPA: amidohydrolase family protein [Candidatus Sulfopaludibacter sp.]|jgi:L-fuconolactonase|nr:amidohydrolase family protein [Candidatus Sulfopaludibacter sp.]